MTQDFDLSFDVDFDDDFDPLAEVDTDEEADSDVASPEPELPSLTQAAIPTATTETDERPAEERIAELFDRMRTRRGILLNILRRCMNPCDNDALAAYIDELQKDDCSVFDAANLCHLLERCGSIIRTLEDGTPYEYDPEPRVVTVDGIEYLEAAEAPKLYWLITPAGIAAVEADNPADRISELFAQEKSQRYLSIYHQVLQMCANEGGAAAKTLSDTFDSHEAMQNPRVYTLFIIDQLQKAGAIEWKKTWQATDAGRAALENLRA